LFDVMISNMDINIDYTPEGSNPLISLTNYIETMQISLWETTFFREFVADKGVYKNNKPYDQLNLKEAVRRVLYRYFKFVLVPANAVSRTPSFFANYLDKDSEDCIFTEAMLKLWDPIHFSTCGWYLDCPIQKPSSFKITLRESLEPTLVGKVSKALVMSPKVPAKRARKRKTQHHVVDVLHGENEDDTDIIELSQQVNVVGPSSPRSKRPKFTHQVPIPPASSSPAPLSHLSSSMKGRM
jgi:hypothetical protein